MKPAKLLTFIGLTAFILVSLDGVVSYILINYHDPISPAVKFARNIQPLFLILEFAMVVLYGFTITRRLNEEENLIKEMEKFKLAVESVADTIFITNTDGIVIYANPAFEKITGYAVDEVLGMKAGKIWGKLMSEDFYKNMWKTIKNDKKIFFGTIKNKRKNGELYDSAVSIGPILDKTGEPLFFVAIERDVTKDAALDRAKTEFVSLASHQLRTPLTAISWYMELLINGEAGKLNKKQTEYMERVAQGNRKMIELVNSLLDISRMELGTFMVNPELSDICELMNETLNELKPIVKKSKIDLIYSCGDNIPKLLLDKRLTKFIFQNLISNAVKYTQEGGVVKVDLVLKGDNVLLSVSDNGIGIPEHQKNEIFKKFFRADNVRVKDTEGTGLGLYLVKTIIDSIDADVWFESKENVGSTFYVRIPLTGEKEKGAPNPLPKN